MKPQLGLLTLCVIFEGPVPLTQPSRDHRRHKNTPIPTNRAIRRYRNLTDHTLKQLTTEAMKNVSNEIPTPSEWPAAKASIPSNSGSRTTVAPVGRSPIL